MLGFLETSGIIRGLHAGTASPPPLRLWYTTVVSRRLDYFFINPYPILMPLLDDPTTSRLELCFTLCAPLLPSISNLFAGCESLLVTPIDSKPPSSKHLQTSKL
ncbi:hypothetical protein Rs2_21348 [Raphanus sativus]|nr:hypothetical protein Rs2_21348 [Raphanus sativus]